MPERIIARGIDGAPFDPPNSRSANYEWVTSVSERLSMLEAKIGAER